MAAPMTGIRFTAVPNNGGIDLSILIAGKTAISPSLSRAELEDILKAINAALDGDGESTDFDDT